jgi:hypothetical protein
MDSKTDTTQSSSRDPSAEQKSATKSKPRSRRKDGNGDGEDASKRRCVSTACIGTLLDPFPRSAVVVIRLLIVEDSL